MRCDYCPLCPRDDICPESENSYGIEYKNCEYGCKHPRNWVDKKIKEYDEYYSNMGTDMGIEMSMTKSELERAIVICKHMVGLDYQNPYIRHGKKFYKPYRNYYESPLEGNRILDLLPSYIVRRKMTKLSIWYELTEEGLSWLGRQAKIIIK